VSYDYLVNLVFTPFAPPPEVVAATLQSIGPSEVKHDHRVDQVMVAAGDQAARLYFEPPSPPRKYGDFETWPPDLVPDRGQIVVILSDNQLVVTRIILALAEQFEFIVDPRRGELYDHQAFAKRCLAEPEWDWDHGPNDIFYFVWPPSS
jgi:hypothetical protein